MRIILIGAVEGSDVALQAMNAAGFPPVLLLTLSPDTGRQRHVDYVDLAPFCAPPTELRHVEDMNAPEVIDQLRSTDADFIFIIGWSQMATAELRSAAGQATIGFHPTPLPRLRGRAPVAWTILTGERSSGTTLFVLDDGVDSGDILEQELFELEPRETAASLIEKNKQALAAMLDRLLPRLANGTARRRPQPREGVSYGARRRPEDALIDWRQSAMDVDRLIRAQGKPYGGAFTFTRRRRVTIWSAEPIELKQRHHAAYGQIVLYEKARPVVLCGGHTFLRLDAYEAVGREAGVSFTGQISFRPFPGQTS